MGKHSARNKGGPAFWIDPAVFAPIPPEPDPRHREGVAFNSSRILAAVGARQLGALRHTFIGSYARTGAVITLVYAVGMVIVWFAPETKAPLLPEYCATLRKKITMSFHSMIRIVASKLHRAELRARMPFRYGIATMTELPHVFLTVTLEVQGRVHQGIAADHLPPKWFTKDPSRDLASEIDEMLRVILHAMKGAASLTGETPFDLWWQLYQTQSAWARQEGIPPLLAHFGTSLVERAMLDAWSRAQGRPLHALLHADGLGLDLGRIHPELADSRASDWLPAQPLARVLARHTVGLSDPLTNGDIVTGDRVDDGLPQSLEECIRTYGLRHFKLKVSGHSEAAIDRLERIAVLLGQLAPTDWACSVDGNESFANADQFREFMGQVSARPALGEFRRRILFIEQPFHRAIALTAAIGKLASDSVINAPMIIDESDAELGSLSAALDLGYAGTSHKNCKGVFKSIVNACRLSQLARAHPEGRYLMSGEDLSNIGPVALLQDLAVQAALGITSVERNGHHYFSGLSLWPTAVQTGILDHHGDLYTRSERGWPTLRICDGMIALETVNAAPFGIGFLPDPAAFTVPVSSTD